MIFSQNKIEQVFLTIQKLEIKRPQIFKINVYQISENVELEKKFTFSGVKIGTTG